MERSFKIYFRTLPCHKARIFRETLELPVFPIPAIVPKLKGQIFDLLEEIWWVIQKLETLRFACFEAAAAVAVANVNAGANAAAAVVATTASLIMKTIVATLLVIFSMCAVYEINFQEKHIQSPLVSPMACQY